MSSRYLDIIHTLIVITILITISTSLKVHNRNNIKQIDICNGVNDRRLYIEPGEKGYISSNFTKFVDRFTINGRRYSKSNITVHSHCTLELVTCPSCIISVIFRKIKIPKQCDQIVQNKNNTCECDYVWISEPAFENNSEDLFCGISEFPSMSYRSQTRNIIISFLYSQNHTGAFILEYTTERNREFYKGQPNEKPQNISSGVLHSPFFPALYPRDLTIEHIIICDVDKNTKCQIRVIFTDFQISTISVIEFYDWNGDRLDITNGAIFRPRIITSSGPSLLIRFYANGGTGFGYKANYSFMSNNNTKPPTTDCGGLVDNLGGAITMMNMVDQGSRVYDCIWIIRPPKNYLLKTHLYIKVATFEEIGNAKIKIHKGVTSNKTALETLQISKTQTDEANKIEHVVPINVGFYVSLKGTFNIKSRLAIVYASFTYKDCFTDSNYLCRNHRCISIRLQCDGFDNCGDSSDEPDSCNTDWKMEHEDVHWYSHSHIPNYYFPKMEDYPDLRTATLVFIFCSLGLIALISVLIILLYRLGARAREQQELQNQIQTISNFLDGSMNNDDNVDEPPVYEAPPEYDEIIKIGFDESNGQRRSKKRTSTRSRSKSVPTRNSLCKRSKPSVPHITIEADTLRPIVQASTSRACQTPSIPESPPPPYLNVSTPDSDVYNSEGYSENKLMVAFSLSESNTSSYVNIEENTSTQSCTPNTWISHNNESTTKNLRRCRSEDDILNPIEKTPPSSKITYQNYETPHVYSSDGDLKMFDRSFKDKSMKLFFDNLFVKAKYPRNSYRRQSVECDCSGACNCYHGVRVTSEETLMIVDETRRDMLSKNGSGKKVKINEAKSPKNNVYLSLIRNSRSTEST